MADLLNNPVAPALLLAVGALLLISGAAAAWYLRGVVKDPGGVEARLQVRRLQAKCMGQDRQLAAANDVAQQMWTDPRTPIQIRLQLERDLLPRLAKREDR